MALVAFVSAKGSPGATTTALLCAALWPSPVLLVDADTEGGDVALRLRREDGAPVDRSRGLLSLLPLARREMQPSTLPEHASVITAACSRPPSSSARAARKPSQRSSSSTRCGSRSSGAALARCSLTLAKPPIASTSWRRATSSTRRSSSRVTRSVWVRWTTAPQWGSAVSGSRPPLPQSRP